jgi:hypothetical protein
VSTVSPIVNYEIGIAPKDSTADEIEDVLSYYNEDEETPEPAVYEEAEETFRDPLDDLILTVTYTDTTGKEQTYTSLPPNPTIEQLKQATVAIKPQCVALSTGYSCGIHDNPAAPTGAEYMPKAGDELAMGSTMMEVVKIDGSGNGLGIATVKAFNNAKYGVEFKGIKVKEGGCIYAGEAVTKSLDFALLSRTQREELEKYHAVYNAALNVVDSLAPEIAKGMNTLLDALKSKKAATRLLLEENDLTKLPEILTNCTDIATQSQATQDSLQKLYCGLEAGTIKGYKQADIKAAIAANIEFMNKLGPALKECNPANNFTPWEEKDCKGPCVFAFERYVVDEKCFQSLGLAFKQSSNTIFLLEAPFPGKENQQTQSEDPTKVYTISNFLDARTHGSESEKVYEVSNGISYKIKTYGEITYYIVNEGASSDPNVSYYSEYWYAGGVWYADVFQGQSTCRTCVGVSGKQCKWQTINLEIGQTIGDKAADMLGQSFATLFTAVASAPLIIEESARKCISAAAIDVALQYGIYSAINQWEESVKSPWENISYLNATASCGSAMASGCNVQCEALIQAAVGATDNLINQYKIKPVISELNYKEAIQNGLIQAAIGAAIRGSFRLVQYKAYSPSKVVLLLKLYTSNKALYNNLKSSSGKTKSFFINNFDNADSEILDYLNDNANFKLFQKRFDIDAPKTDDLSSLDKFKVWVQGAGSLDDLVSWASKNGLGNLTQAEIKGTFDLFEGNITFAQKALLSSKEIVAGKTLPELAQHFNLPTIPSAQSLTPYQARVWYSWRKSQISTSVNRSNGLEAAAREALEMRNTIRTTTRQSMKDTDIADFLNTKEVNMTWEDAMSKYNGNYEEIIQASMRGRGVVDILFQIPK